VLRRQYAATRGEISARAMRKSQNEFSKNIFLPRRFESIESNGGILRRRGLQTRNSFAESQGNPPLR
jgi:hypothetical protein